MFEKVNPCHPDKIADRIAGAIVDLAYKLDDNPKIAVEVLIGHGQCNIIAETNVEIGYVDVVDAVTRIANDIVYVQYKEVKQDEKLANNQLNKIRCGDNGIFKGTPLSFEEIALTAIAQSIFARFGTDGKYIIESKPNNLIDKLIICQSNADDTLQEAFPNAIVNPLGPWTGGIDVDCGATNRKLGSDMGGSITGGGLHGKDLSKADVSVNIYAWLKAQQTGEEVNLCCAIGDEEVDGKPYSDIVDIAKQYIKHIGGFEKFAEWGLIR